MPAMQISTVAQFDIPTKEQNEEITKVLLSHQGLFSDSWQAPNMRRLEFSGSADCSNVEVTLQRIQNILASKVL